MTPSQKKKKNMQYKKDGEITKTSKNKNKL